jgi:hypothetical protein
MLSNLFLNDVFLLRHTQGYLGHSHRGANVEKSKVFTFRNLRIAKEVASKLTHQPFVVSQYNEQVYQLQLTQKPVDWKPQELEAECFGLLNAQIYLSMNNVDLHLVDNCFDSDDGDIFLVSTKPTSKVLKGMFINDDMLKIHLKKIVQL